jgi:heat shock protein HslJ
MELKCFIEMVLICLLIAVPMAAAEDAEVTGTATASGLEGVAWTLDSLLDPNGETVGLLPYTEITATFESGVVSGHGGCNSYRGGYTTDGQNINISNVISTLMFCYDNISTQETNYLMNLQKATTYNVSDNLLKMADANGTTLLTFSVVQPVPLPGSNWSMISYNNGQALMSVLTGTEVSANFGVDGNLTGSAGCNNYMANYQIEDNKIDIGPAAATRMLCSEPEGIMEQEQDYLKAIESAATYRIERQQLWLFFENESIAAIFDNSPAI